MKAPAVCILCKDVCIRLFREVANCFPSHTPLPPYPHILIAVFPSPHQPDPLPARRGSGFCPQPPLGPVSSAHGAFTHQLLRLAPALFLLLPNSRIGNDFLCKPIFFCLPASLNFKQLEIKEFYDTLVVMTRLEFLHFFFEIFSPVE